MSDSMGGSYTPPPPPPPGSMPPPPPPPAGTTELVYPSNPPKDPIVTLVLNLVLLCVGYFYIGQWQKGIVAIVSAFVIGIPTCGLGAGAVAVAAGIDGMQQAEHLKAGHPVGQWTFFKDHR
jgi:hypothetical protein